MRNANVSFTRIFGLIAALFALSLTLAAQTLPVAGQLTDVQAQAMMQALAAQAQGQAGAAMTQAQVQMLLQYLTKASSGNAAQTQMMMQALAQSQAAAPNAAISAAQAQALAKMMTMQPGMAMPGMAMPGMAMQQPIGNRGMQAPAPGLNIPGAAPQPTIGTTLGPKKPGTIRIGVVEPRAQIAQSGPGANIAEPLRGLIVRYLSGPALEVISLAAVLPPQAQAEAKQKECDFMLLTAVSQKLDAGKMGMFKKAMPIANMIPMVGMAGMAGAAASAAGAAASAAAATTINMGSGVKAKADVTLEYQLVVPDTGAAVLGNSLSAKAKTDGEDVITPLIEQADGAIFAAVTKK